MPRRLKPYIIGVVAASVFALVATTLVIPIDPQIAPGGTALGEAGKYIGVLFWIVVCLVAQALPVRMLRDVLRVRRNADERDNPWRAYRRRLGRTPWDHRSTRTTGPSSLVWDADEPCRCDSAGSRRRTCHLPVQPYHERPG